MTTQTQTRTLAAFIALVFIGAVNTVAGVTDLYSEWVIWSLYALMIVVIALALRFQARLSAGVTAAILALPFVLAALAMALGI